MWPRDLACVDPFLPHTDEALTCNVCDRAFPTSRLLASHQTRKRHYGWGACEGREGKVEDSKEGKEAEDRGEGKGVFFNLSSWTLLSLEDRFIILSSVTSFQTSTHLWRCNGIQRTVMYWFSSLWHWLVGDFVSFPVNFSVIRNFRPVFALWTGSLYHWH